MSVPAPMRNGAPTLTMSIADGIGDSSQPGVRRRSLQVEVVDSPSSGGRGRPREQRRTEAFDGGAAAFAAGGDGGLQGFLPKVMAGSTPGWIWCGVVFVKCGRPQPGGWGLDLMVVRR